MFDSVSLPAKIKMFEKESISKLLKSKRIVLKN